MATKKFIELQEFADEQLANELKETQVQYNKLKFDHAMQGLENPLSIRGVRKDIARMKTEMRSREVLKLTTAQLSKRTKNRK